MIASVLQLAQDSAARPAMVEKLQFLVPEMTLFITTVVVMVLGLSPRRAWRKACAGVSILGLAIAGFAAMGSPAPAFSPLPALIPFAKALIAAVGVLLVLLLTGVVDREHETEVARGAKFESLRSTRGEFYSFALFSLTGLMLCASADDLIWLFLALELTSLPTYVMVSISTNRAQSQEAGVKYFFLGAMGAAMFLYGFALLYGATGTTQLFGTDAAPGIAQILATNVAADGTIGVFATLGMVIAMLGVSFKIAAVPMHFYAPDVYEGAASSVSGFLAFVPKAAGFLTLILLASTVGWHFGADGQAGDRLPEALRITLWVMAALTMTVGNVLALLQRNVKRILAYSSISHSGYMLVGLIAGPGDGRLATNGIGATLYYLLCYGFMNLGAFAVLACLERRGAADGGHVEIETVDDLRGLARTHKALGWTMTLCALSLLGMPPLLGFFGKLFLFTSAISAGEIPLVVVMGVNSAIAAFYYLRLAGAPLLEDAGPAESGLVVTAFKGRIVAAVVSAASVVVLTPASWWLMRESHEAGAYQPERMAAAEQPPAEIASAAGE